MVVLVLGRGEDGEESGVLFVAGRSIGGEAMSGGGLECGVRGSVRYSQLDLVGDKDLYGKIVSSN